MYRQLTRLRLRWYALATGRILMRHWQLFVIACLLLPTNIPVAGILYILAFPLMAVFDSGRDLVWHLSCIALIQLAALVWVLVQRNNISGGKFIGYLGTLPIAQSLQRSADLTVLLLANGILLVPVIGLLLIAPSRLVLTADKGFLIAAVCVLVVLVHLAQLAVLERRRAAFVALAVADLLLSWSVSRPVDTAAWLMLFAALPVATSILLPGMNGLPRWQPPFKAPLHCKALRHPRLSPVWRIQVKAIWAHRPASSAIRMGIALLLATVAVKLINIFEFDQRALPAALLFMGAIALIVSGLYRVLNAIHLPMEHYISSLPLPRHFWILKDTLSVMLFGSVPLIVLLAPLTKHTATAPLLTIAIGYFGLIALLRLPLVYGGRQATLLSVMLAATWSGAAMAAIGG